MSDTLLTIPGVTAQHVLGETIVALGAGELNVFPAPSGDNDVTITVGGAAFSLNKDTPFRTIADQSRTYALIPEIEGIQGGFVKLTLPEGVAEEGSRLAELQTKLEEIMVQRGFLEAAGNESHPMQHIKDAFSL